MNTDHTAPRRPATTALAVLDILIGLAGGGGGLALTALSGLSVHGEDMLPPLGLAAASGLLGVAGVLLLFGGPGRAATGLAGVVAVGGIACAVWRHMAVQPSEGGMLLVAGLIAPVAVVALAQVAYLKR